jgi:ligand-binding SRPBCC domain-containing protein
MLLLIRSPVHRSMHEVWKGFDRSLFEHLLPAFPPTQLLRFDGSMPTHEVHLKIAGQTWVSIITHQESAEKSVYFIDEGFVLPFPLKTWKHKHLIQWVDSDRCVIHDEIRFTTGWKVFDFLLWPLMWIQFYPRKKAYRSYFESII